MKKPFSLICRLVTTACLLTPYIAVAAEPNLSQIIFLLNNGKAHEAYQLLAPQELEMAGNIDFDYALGVAALDIGKTDQAKAALERVLAKNPQYDGAQLDMARTYFALGDYARAKIALDHASTQNPSPLAKSTIAKYLAAIDNKLGIQPSSSLAPPPPPSADAPSTTIPATAAKASADTVGSTIYVPAKGKNAEETYRLLAPREFEMAGNIEFDYALGVAALDSGKPDKATLAFERVLAVNPLHYGAQLDLARAYFALGDYERADNAFRRALEQNPPPLARLTIEQYLAAIDAQLNPKPSFSEYLEATLGSDSNVSAATTNSTMYVPIFGATFSLSSSSTAVRDHYLNIGGGGEATFPIRDGLSFFVGVDGKKRMNNAQDTYNTGSTDGRAGLNIGHGDNVLRLSLQKGAFYLDDKFNRVTQGVSGEWRHIPDPRNQYSVFAQHAALRYGHDRGGSDLSSNDVDQTIVGAGWLHALDEGGKTVIFGSAYGGSERNSTASQRIDGDQEFLGARVGGQAGLNDKTGLFASVGYKFGNYNRVNILFQTYRRDSAYDINLGVNWTPAKNWTVRPQFAYARNDSNVAVNDYDRKDFSVTVRRDFKQ